MMLVAAILFALAETATAPQHAIEAFTPYRTCVLAAVRIASGSDAERLKAAKEACAIEREQAHDNAFAQSLVDTDAAVIDGTSGANLLSSLTEPELRGVIDVVVTPWMQSLEGELDAEFARIYHTDVTD